MEVTTDGLALFFKTVLPHLNERQRRVLAGSTSLLLGDGKKSVVARSSGMSRNTVTRAHAEVRAGMEPSDRQRGPGGGDKPANEKQPGLLDALHDLLRPTESESPGSPLRWTTSSSVALAEELTAKGFQVSSRTVLRLLQRHGYSVRVDKATHGRPDQAAAGQFRYLQSMVQSFIENDQPAIAVEAATRRSVDCFSNEHLRSAPAPDLARTPICFLPRPYELHDASSASDEIRRLGLSEEWSQEGTPTEIQLVIESVERWWSTSGHMSFPSAEELLVAADFGRLTGEALELWNVGLSDLAVGKGLRLTVCHHPPGISRWNFVKHRMCSFRAMHVNRSPIATRATIDVVAAAPQTSLDVQVAYSTDSCRKYGGGVAGQATTTRHDWHGTWNYTIGAPLVPPRNTEQVD